MSEPPPERRAPALGAVAGIKADIKAAKEAALKGEEFNPMYANAWTHDFLNKKPWHPMNFRNREKVWLKEQQKYQDEKQKADGLKEFEAEQHYLKTISMLDPEEQEKYKQRQSVAWLYMKPPGFDETVPASSTAAVPGAIEPQQQQQQQQQHTNNKSSKSGGNYLSKVVGGFKAAVQRGSTLWYKNQSTALPIGGIDPNAPNQQYIVPEIDSEEEEEAYKLAVLSEEERKRLKVEAAKKEREEARRLELAKLEEAKAFLRSAGVEIPEEDDDGSDSSSDSDSSDRKKKRRKSRKSSRKSKRRKK